MIFPSMETLNKECDLIKNNVIKSCKSCNNYNICMEEYDAYCALKENGNKYFKISDVVDAISNLSISTDYIPLKPVEIYKELLKLDIRE